jgi:hypothetical protein
MATPILIALLALAAPRTASVDGGLAIRGELPLLPAEEGLGLR